ncbi:ester cyclase [Halorubrum trueperi]|uniref:Ester cyclase n=1 Tax=Halorubrum trueperi TaxID=2004704 RepID=A0ABD5UPA2_9EURY
MPALVDNKEIVRRFAEEFINEGNYDTAEELLAEDIADHTPLGDTTGRETVVETLKTVRTAFPDFVITPQEIVAEDDTVAVRMTQRGTHQGTFMGIEPTGNAFEIEAMAFVRLEDGKIVERWGRPDLLGLLRQLGLTELPAAPA